MKVQGSTHHCAHCGLVTTRDGSGWPVLVAGKSVMFIDLADVARQVSKPRRERCAHDVAQVVEKIVLIGLAGPDGGHIH